MTSLMLMNIIVSGVFLKRRMFEHKRWSNTEYRQIIEQYLETYIRYPQQKKRLTLQHLTESLTVVVCVRAFVLHCLLVAKAGTATGTAQRNELQH